MNIPLTPIRFLERTEKIYPNKTGLFGEDYRLSNHVCGERGNRLSNSPLKMGVILPPLDTRLALHDFEGLIHESRRGGAS